MSPDINIGRNEAASVAAYNNVCYFAIRSGTN